MGVTPSNTRTVALTTGTFFLLPFLPRALGRTQVPTRSSILQARTSTDGNAGARMSSEVSDELQSLRDSYPCPGIAIRATRLLWTEISNMETEQ
jgi:hypothetical protein